MSAHNSSGSFLFFAILVAVIVAWFVRAARASIGRSTADSSPDLLPKSAKRRPRPVVESEAAAPSRAPTEERVSRLSSELESKIAALEHRIREADRASARLEAALSAIAQHVSPSATAQPAPSFAFDREAEPSQDRPPSQADALRSAGASEYAPAGLSATEPDAPSRPSDGRQYDDIYALSDYGWEPDEIAQRVGTPTGEVELILRLRNKR